MNKSERLSGHGTDSNPYLSSAVDERSKKRDKVPPFELLNRVCGVWMLLLPISYIVTVLVSTNGKQVAESVYYLPFVALVAFTSYHMSSIAICARLLCALYALIHYALLYAASVQLGKPMWMLVCLICYATAYGGLMLCTAIAWIWWRKATPDRIPRMFGERIH